MNPAAGSGSPAPQDAVRQRFDLFLAEALAELESRDDVIGLVGMGSTAARDRVDEWSDHDLAVIVCDDAHDRYRDPFAWLPRPEEIALAVREWHDGVKVLYDDGHVVEFGAATLPELRGWDVDANAVYLDRGGVAEAAGEAATRPRPHGRPDTTRDLGVFLVALVIGIGRARRGELLNANAVLRGQAAEALVAAVSAGCEPESAAPPDSLDVTRRFEVRHPAVAARLVALLERDLEGCARGMYELAAEIFGERLPTRASAAVRARLGWSQKRTP